MFSKRVCNSLFCSAMNKKLIVLFLFLCMGIASVLSQPTCHVTRYNETDGVPSSRIAQLLQDRHGFMWFATWNGLCRYDGYEFQTFKPRVGDGSHMPSDRFRNITLLPTGNILCKVDEEYCLFDTHTYRFRDLTSSELANVEQLAHKYRQSRSLQRRNVYTWTDAYHTRWSLHSDGTLTYLDTAQGKEVTYPVSVSFNAASFVMADRDGNLWAIDAGNIYKFVTNRQRTTPLAIEPAAEVRCLFADSKGRYWVTTKEDAAVRLYSRHDDRLIGYLGSDGTIHSQHTPFASPVYTIYESNDGTLWLGTKPGGLFRLRPQGEGYSVEHITHIPFHDIYHIITDRWGRLWVAALDGGIAVSTNPMAAEPTFAIPRNYPKDVVRARYLYIDNGQTLLVATSSGLLTAPLERQYDSMKFHLYQRTGDMAGGLSCSATMDVCADRQGRIYVSTESGGVNLINANLNLDETRSDEPQANSLTFRHLRDELHIQSNDVVQSLHATADGGMLAVGSHLISLIDKNLMGRTLDIASFNRDYRFSEAHPLLLDRGRWLFGLTTGAFFITGDQLMRRSSSPHIVLTALNIQGGDSRWEVEGTDTLTLNPHERSVTLHFAAMDYKSSDRICYAFRLLKDGERDTTQWNYLGRNRSVTLLDMEPSTYILEIRSTNAEGDWLDNERRLTIIVPPTFWESTIGRLLLILFIVGIIGGVAATLIYIRRIKRQQRDTLAKYLAMLEKNDATDSVPLPSIEVEPDPMLQRIMQFVEENIGNSDAGVGDMAAAAATSRSGLLRKLHRTMGITPQDLLREARIKHACQLLRHSDKSVSEIAYACGFADPKYFSRCFKQSVGSSPTEYKAGN